MKKSIGLVLTICVLLLSMSLIGTAATPDPVQLLLVDVLSWEESARLAFNNEVLVPLVDGTVTDAIVDAAKAKLPDGKIENFTQADIQSALEAFQKADKASKQIFTNREMINGYHDLGNTLTGFDTFRKQVNREMTGNELNDNGIRFATLFLRELVYTNYKLVGDKDKSIVATYDGSKINFLLKSGIDAANKEIIVTRVNNLLLMLDNFCSEVLSNVAISDSSTKIDSLPDDQNFVGKFLTYTEDQINKCGSSEISAFYSFLLNNSPIQEGVTLPIIERISSGGSSHGGSPSVRTPTPTPTETPTPTPTVTPTPTPTIPGDYHKFDDIDNVPWAEEAINYLAYNEIVLGTSDTTFSPNLGIKRGDLALLMVRIFGLESDETGNFDDVTAGSYYADACRIGKANGVLLGVDYENRYYEPERTITREEMMALVVRSLVALDYMEEPTEVDLSKFVDGDLVQGYAAPYATYLAKEGIVQGDNQNRINPSSNVTRAEAAVMLYRLYKEDIVKMATKQENPPDPTVTPAPTPEVTPTAEPEESPTPSPEGTEESPSPTPSASVSPSPTPEA